MHTGERANRERRAAFTLLEIALSVSLLIVLAAGVIAFFAISAKMQNTSREREVARIAAASKLEEIVAWLEYDTLATAFSGSTFAAGPLTSPGGGPPGRVTVDRTNPDLLRITVTVNWIGASGADMLELSTTIANPDPGL